MTSLFNFGKNLYSNFYLKRSLKATIYAKKGSEVTQETLDFIASKTETQEDIQTILEFLGEILKHPSKVKTEEKVNNVVNTFKLIQFLIINGSEVCIPHFREKADSYLIYTQVKDIFIDFSTLNESCENVINLLKDDELLKERREHQVENKRIAELEMQSTESKKEDTAKQIKGIIDANGFQEVECGSPSKKTGDKKGELSLSGSSLGLKFIINTVNRHDDEQQCPNQPPLENKTLDVMLRSPEKPKKKGFFGFKLRLGAPPTAKMRGKQLASSVQSTQESQDHEQYDDFTIAKYSEIQTILKTGN